MYRLRSRRRPIPGEFTLAEVLDQLGDRRRGVLADGPQGVGRGSRSVVARVEQRNEPRSCRGRIQAQVSVSVIDGTIRQQPRQLLDGRRPAVVRRESRAADAQRPQVGHPAQCAHGLFGDVLGEKQV